MKKINRYLIIALFSSVLFSCEDAYQVAVGDEIVDENAINSVPDVVDATIGVYSAVDNVNSIEWNSAFTDEVTIAPSNNGQGIQVHGWSINSATPEVNGIFGGYYLPIARANKILSLMPNITPKDADEQAIMDRSRGELLFIRAFSHFELLRFYATSFTDLNAPGIPYVDYVVVLGQPARNTVGEVYAKLESDLVEASSLLPDAPRDATKPAIYASKDAIIALQARIALYKGDYATAISLTSTLIDGRAGKYALATAAEFPAVWSDSNDKENIFKLSRVLGDGQQRVGTIFQEAGTDGTVYYNPTAKLINIYDATDVRRSVYISADGKIVNKYPGISGSPKLNDIKIFRISEMYLIRSEAYAKSNNLTAAAEDYNELSAARHTAPVAAVTFTSTSDAVNKILDESFREFAFEGFRFFDLKRNGKGVERIGADCDTPTCTLVAGDYRFSLPVPSSEIKVNDNITQTPGY